MTTHPLPDAKKVLVFAPHPDDEALGCGGTIALYSLKGVDVHLAVISSGEKIAIEFVGDIDIAQVRRQELEASSRILGIKQVHFLGFPDGELAFHKEDIEKKLRELIDEIKPDIIFTPSPFEHHDDHRAVSEAAINFLIEGCAFKVAFYEVYGTIRFNTLIDISSVIAIKEEAVKNYHHSLMRQPELYNESIKGLNRFRSFYVIKLGYYEAFWVVSSPLTYSEIYSWLTYGMDCVAARFLTKHGNIEELLLEMSKKNQALSSKEAEIAELIQANKQAVYEAGELKLRLSEIQNSLAWSFAKKYYKLRDALLPDGSILREIYNKIMLFIKGR